MEKIHSVVAAPFRGVLFKAEQCAKVKLINYVIYETTINNVYAFPGIVRNKFCHGVLCRVFNCLHDIIPFSIILQNGQKSRTGRSQNAERPNSKHRRTAEQNVQNAQNMQKLTEHAERSAEHRRTAYNRHMLINADFHTLKCYYATVSYTKALHHNTFAY